VEIPFDRETWAMVCGELRRDGRPGLADDLASRVAAEPGDGVVAIPVNQYRYTAILDARDAALRRRHRLTAA
jgi:hypothetical protein